MQDEFFDLRKEIDLSKHSIISIIRDLSESSGSIRETKINHIDDEFRNTDDCVQKLNAELLI